MQKTEYLTESNLGVYLKGLFPDKEFIQDRVVPNSGIKNRADYRNDRLNLIIEFDGYRHYSEAKVILLDKKKDEIYTKMGFNVVRIPYFVQFSKIVLLNLFSIETEWNQKYPHGFIDNKALLPANYCELGIKRFVSDLDRFDYLKDEILKSLKNKIEILGDKKLVLPEFLFGLI